MKKIIASLTAILLAVLPLASCGSQPAPADGQKLSVVSTIFPSYDWIREILGDKADQVNLTLLLDDGIDLHSFQPTTEDMVTISTCDLFVYVGGESDAWVEDALQTAVNKDMLVVNLMEVLGDQVKVEEIKEGMEEEEEGEEEGAEEAEEEFDEHVWLSLKHAQTLCSYLAGELGRLDQANAAVYQANAGEYINKLKALDGSYAAAVNGAARRTLLFGDRFPFRYLADDYGLDYFAAFPGCSAETEASFETIVFLAGKTDELGLTNIMTLETSDQAIAKTIAQNTKDKTQQVLVLDSLQSVTAADIAAGATYLSVMESNLDILKAALS
jgi:zinc transport system substrate-binding protein